MSESHRYIIAINDLGAASSAIVAGAVKWALDRGRYDVARDLAQLANTLAELEADDAMARAYGRTLEQPRTGETAWRPPLCALRVASRPSGDGEAALSALRAEGELCTCPPGACEARAPMTGADGTVGRCKTCGHDAVLLVVDPHGTAEARHVATTDVKPFDHPADFVLAEGDDQADEPAWPACGCETGAVCHHEGGALFEALLRDTVQQVMPYVCGTCTTRWPTEQGLLGHRRLVHGAH